MTVPDTLWGARVGDIVELHDGDELVLARVTGVWFGNLPWRKRPKMELRLLDSAIPLTLTTRDLIARVLPCDEAPAQEAARG